MLRHLQGSDPVAIFLHKCNRVIPGCDQDGLKKAEREQVKIKLQLVYLFFTFCFDF